MSNMYGIYTKKGKILAIGTKKDVKRYVYERQKKDVKVLDISDILDWNICESYILREYGDHITNDCDLGDVYLMTLKEKEMLYGLYEAFLTDVKYTIDELQSMITCIKDETFKVMIEDGINGIDNIIFNDFNSNDYIDNDVDILKILSDFSHLIGDE